MSKSGGPSLPAVLARIGAARSLGLGNVARVLLYRLGLKTGIHPVQRVATGAPPPGPFFGAVAAPRPLPVPRAWQHAANYFGWYQPDQPDGPPDWHRNPFDGRRAAGSDADWWTIGDFDPATGDIKAIWEASRLDWVVNFAQQARAGSSTTIERLNRWLADWSERNPPYRGHNWKCAQEASIRVMHLAVAALILDETANPQRALIDLLVAHLRRIAPTMSYAIAQDNNHGTSEAAALFIGGSWLERLGRSEGPRWHRKGRHWLENRAQRLIQPDGSFSQYSVSYHRLMLDTLSLVEVWRRHLDLQAFSDDYRIRASAATAWLLAMVDPVTGDAPNCGANDGANLLPLTDADYRDFRPAVQVAATLFENRSAYAGAGSWQAQLSWLGLQGGREEVSTPASGMFDNGGHAVLRSGDARAILRYPRFRFRPSHADALHVDLWVAGKNLLRDGGSFSYSADQEWQDYFAGARGHNTVQFDDREQMLRLSRFLWGRWLQTRTLTPIKETAGAVSVAASYQDYRGAVHERTLELERGSLTVRDRLSGFRSKAVLRWRLCPGDWILDGTAVSNGHHRLEVWADVPIVRQDVVGGWESRYYMQKTAIPVLEVELASPGMVTTRYQWLR